MEKQRWKESEKRESQKKEDQQRIAMFINQWNMGKPIWQTHIPYHDINDRWWWNDLAQSKYWSRKAEALYYSQSGFFECNDACQKAYDKASCSKFGESRRLQVWKFKDDRHDRRHTVNMPCVKRRSECLLDLRPIPCESWSNPVQKFQRIGDLESKMKTYIALKEYMGDWGYHLLSIYLATFATPVDAFDLLIFVVCVSVFYLRLHLRNHSRHPEVAACRCRWPGLKSRECLGQSQMADGWEMDGGWSTESDWMSAPWPSMVRCLFRMLSKHIQGPRSSRPCAFRRSTWSWHLVFLWCQGVTSQWHRRGNARRTRNQSESHSRF